MEAVVARPRPDADFKPRAKRSPGPHLYPSLRTSNLRNDGAFSSKLRYPEHMVPSIAISYRRSDSQDITGRIFDRLRQHFGRDSVFRDIDNIRPGIDFRVQISEALRTTDVLLVIMGPKWFGRAKGEGVRINNEADPVRIEVETALQRDIPVIPVLVGNMRMPTTAQLPDGLKDLAYRHAVTVDGGRDFDHHLAGLIRALESILENKVEVANTKLVSDQQGIPPKQPFGDPSPGTTDAVEARVAPGNLSEKVPSEVNLSHSRPRNVADHPVEPSAAPLQREILKPIPNEPSSTALLRSIWPKRPNRRFLRAGLIVFVSVVVGGLAVSTYVAETSRPGRQLEDARGSEEKAAEDVRKASETKAAEDARKATEAKAAEDARKAAEAKAAEDARKTAETKAAETKSPSTSTTTLTKVTASTQTQPVPAGDYGDRIALVIANAKYPDADAPLKEPINDARDLADELKRDRFDVEFGENLTGDAMRRALDRLYGRIGRIKHGSTALVFFSGFGLQSNRQSYMIPVDAQIWTEADIHRDGFSLQTVLEEINNRGAGVKIALIDASRRNPFERRFRSFSAGLAPVNAPSGTLVMYSASLSSIISDNGGDHGLFVQELLKEIRVPGLMAEETLNRVRVGVTSASRAEQVPWISSSLDQDFSFIPPRNSVAR